MELVLANNRRRKSVNCVRQVLYFILKSCFFLYFFYFLVLWGKTALVPWGAAVLVPWGKTALAPWGATVLVLWGETG